jgi:hypothetical protein
MATVTVTSDLGLFHINEALSQFAQGYAQDADNMIADKLMPPIMVDQKSDQYYIGQTEHLQLSDVNRAPGSLFPQVEWAVTDDGYVCKSYGVEVTAPWEMPRNADAAIDVEQENVTLAVDRLLLASEYRTMTALTNTSTFSHAAASAKWNAVSSGVSTEDPYVDVEAAKAVVVGAIGHVPNTLWMNYNTFRALMNNTFIKDRVKYTQPGAMITPQVLANVFDVDQILVAKALYDSSVPGSGATPSMSYVWPDGYVGVAYIDNRVGPLRAKILAPGRTFVWTAMGGRFATRSYVFDPRMANVVQCVDYVDEKVTCAGAQYLLTGCI